MSVRFRLRVFVAGEPTRLRPANTLLTEAGCARRDTSPDENPASYRRCDR